jgi:arginine decarboxylase
MTPYADALRRHAERDPLMFMVPSHAATPHGLTEDLADLVGERAVTLDIPVLVDGIDVGPESPFVEATRLAAEAWGAKRTWFLANGSSQGNRMAVVAAHALGLSDTILAQRSAHSSFTDGLVVSGAQPEWIVPAVDAERGINHGLTPEQLDAALGRKRGPVYVVSPSYFGAVADVAGLARVAHGHGVPLIVDAAWGAHFGFHPDLPDFPTRQGADVVVTSTHKMGGSLGQAALLHLGEGPDAQALEPALERAYQLTQTTSASSLLLGSIDVARRSLALGADRIGESIELAEALRERIRAIPGLAVVSDDFGDHPDIVDVDPLRVSIDVRGSGLTGYAVREALANEHAIYVEIATRRGRRRLPGPGQGPGPGPLRVGAVCRPRLRHDGGCAGRRGAGADAPSAGAASRHSPRGVLRRRRDRARGPCRGPGVGGRPGRVPARRAERGTRRGDHRRGPGVSARRGGVPHRLCARGRGSGPGHGPGPGGSSGHVGWSPWRRNRRRRMLAPGTRPGGPLRPR